MRKFVWLFAVALLASGGSALAQSACPTDGSCPTDVGACLAESCPCDGPGQPWKNHGQFVKCVVHLRNDLRKDGCLDDRAKRMMAKCAARSTCGKEGAVLCCVYDTSVTCNDAVPGDGTKAGVCSNAANTACDTATDCITPRVSRHAEGCTDRGGTVVGGGSVCSACPIPPPAP